MTTTRPESAGDFPRARPERLTARSFLGTIDRDGWVSDPAGPVKVVPADAIVIDPADLPKVLRWTVGDRPWFVGEVNIPHDISAEEAWRVALAHLALARRLAAHPPADEAQVEALAEALSHLDLSGDVGPKTLARRLVERGVRVEVTP